MSSKRRVIIGVTGASGGIYAVRTIRAFLIHGFEIHLIVSDYGNFVLKESEINIIAFALDIGSRIGFLISSKNKK